jgi:multidrug efflux pump subunit AcrB
MHHALTAARAGKGAVMAGLERLRERLERALLRFVERRYRPVLAAAVRHRGLTLSIAAGALLVSLALVAGGYVPFVFFPEGESDWVIAEVSFPLGSPFSATEEAVSGLERAAFAIERDYPEFTAANGALVRNAFSLVGMIPRRDWKPEEIGGHVGQVWIEIAPTELRRGLSTATVINQWRRRAGEIPGVEQLSFSTIEGGPAGNDIEIQLSGKDFDLLQQAAAELKAELRTFPGTFDVADNFKPGKPEQKLAIREGARAVGVTMRDLARQVRQGFYGEEAQRIQRGRDDVRVMVRYPEAERRSLGDLEHMRVRAPDGGEVPFSAVARARIGRGYSTIRRSDRERIVSVTADVDRSRTTGNEVLAALRAGPLPEILRDYPGASYRLEGIQDEQARALGGLATAYPVALFAIYALLAIPLGSYLQPLLIMSVIPFGMVGAIAGHVLTRQGLSFMSVQGMIALSGVVVNASLILVHDTNERVAAGASLREAVIESAVARFRPIVLTSLTTFAGLTPLLLERSVQAQFLIPMATSLGFGVIVATAITLVLLPCAALILEDLRALPARVRRPERPRWAAAPALGEIPHAPRDDRG